jgi:SH3-like domain-containing protein
MHKAQVLRDLCAALRAEPRSACDWSAVLAMANESLVTPQLAAASARSAHQVPRFVSVFLDEVLRRNRMRNRRLWLQLNDTVAALNMAGIEPVLLKGAALWAPMGEEQPFDRILSDIDLLVAPGRADDAIAALAGAGFQSCGRPSSDEHVIAELRRDQDVGYLDLHWRPPGPVPASGNLDSFLRSSRLRIEGGTVHVPDAASQIFHLVLHDCFHDRGYWRGGFDLRHLIDIARLAEMMTEEQREWLLAACGTKLMRAALKAQLVSADRLIGRVGPAHPTSLRSSLTYWRWFLQCTFPRSATPLAVLAAAIEWRDICAHRGTGLFGQRCTQTGPRGILALCWTSLNRVDEIMQSRFGKI